MKQNKKLIFIPLIIVAVLAVFIIIMNKNNIENTTSEKTTTIQKFNELSFKLPADFTVFSEYSDEIIYSSSVSDCVISVKTDKLFYDSVVEYLKKVESHPENNIKQKTINNHVWYEVKYTEFEDRFYTYTTEKNGTLYKLHINSDENNNESTMKKVADIVVNSLSF